MTTTLLGPLPTSVTDAVAHYAAWLSLLCIAPLAVQTIRGRAHPPAVTWGVWAPVGLVASFALAFSGQPFGTWYLKLFLSLGPLIMFIVAAIWAGNWRTDRFDWAAIAIAVGGTSIYIGAFNADDPRAPYVAVVMAMLVDTAGIWPTWRRAWRNPRDGFTAQVATFGLAAVSVIAVLLTLPWPWTFLSAGLLLFLLAQMISIIAVFTAGQIRERRREEPGNEIWFGEGVRP
jgi:hypothetical protein